MTASYVEYTELEFIAIRVDGRERMLPRKVGFMERLPPLSLVANNIHEPLQGSIA